VTFLLSAHNQTDAILNLGKGVARSVGQKRTKRKVVEEIDSLSEQSWAAVVLYKIAMAVCHVHTSYIWFDNCCFWFCSGIKPRTYGPVHQVKVMTTFSIVIHQSRKFLNRSACRTGTVK